MKQIDRLLNSLKADIRLRDDVIIERHGRYFLISTDLRDFAKGDFYYAGSYLGKIKERVFFPSFVLLSMIAEQKANKAVVDDKAAWLFICGRDIFKRGVLDMTGSRKRGSCTLVLNEYGECLGFGKILLNIDQVRNPKRVVIMNISDIGDFLRREKQPRPSGNI